MNQGIVSGRHEELVQAYFAYVRELREGREDAVNRLVDMWDPDGVFEFAGAEPLTGVFRGRAAIHVLYKHRLGSGNMRVELQGGNEDGDRETALAVMDIDLYGIRESDNGTLAQWGKRIGTADGRGFQVAGSHTFTFKDGKISGLRIIVSPHPEPTANLTLEGLTVEDVGRLALAAWAVV